VISYTKFRLWFEIKNHRHWNTQNVIYMCWYPCDFFGDLYQKTDFQTVSAQGCIHTLLAGNLSLLVCIQQGIWNHRQI